MHTIEQVLDLDAMREEIAELGEQVAAPDLWDDQANAHARDRPALGAAGRARPVHGARRPHRRPRDDGRARPGGGRRRRRSPRPRRSSGKIKKAVEALEVRTLLSGEYDAREALVTIRSGAGGVDAADFAEMLMRMYIRWAEQQQVPRRGLRHLLRRGGRPQVRDLRDPRALRLRHALGRGRHPPPGADQPVRQPGPPPDVVRRRRGGAGARADRRDRDPRRGRSASTSTAPAAPAASRSTPPTPPSGSPTSRPASSSAARTRRASSRTRPARWWSSRPSCSR